MFGTGMNGVLKVMLQQRCNPEDILNVDGFKGKWAECLKLRTEEIVAERAMSQVEGGAEHEEDDAEAEEALLVSRPALAKSSASCPENSKDYWDAFAAEQVRQYVRLVTEPATAAALAAAIKNSALNLELKGEPGKSAVLIVLEVDNLQEQMTRPWDRKPPVNQGVITKLIQGALSARGGVRYDIKADAADGAPAAAGGGEGEAPEVQQIVTKFVAPCDQDILFLFDGGRDHLKSVLRGA